MYYQYGNCLNVSETCDKYDAYTGNCLSCVNNSFDYVNGFCILKNLKCAPNQYQSNFTCVNAS